MKTLRFIAFMMLFHTAAFAADLKVSQMPAATSVATTDLLMLVQGSSSKKATVGQVALGGVGYAANAGTVSNTIPVRDGSGKLPGSITGDADTVDGLHAGAFATAIQGATADKAAPTGTVITFAGSTCPTGWLAANGSAVSRTGQVGLYGVIGTTYGTGDGTTTYNLPDLRGEFVRGWDNGRGVDTGRAIGSSQSDLFKAHTHTVSEGSLTAGSGNLTSGDDYTDGIHASQTTSSTGGAETRPRNVALLYCIKP